MMLLVSRSNRIRIGFLLILHCSITLPLKAVDPKATWPGWRGADRDGHTAALPEKWSTPKLIWEAALKSNGVGGVAAVDDFIVVSSRDEADREDIFTCIDPFTGAVLWTFQYPAPANLDYGNSPRATPMIHDPWVYLQGAAGHLTCIDLDTGEAKWRKHFIDDLHGELPIWGYAASPLVIDDKLIVQPGGGSHSITALALETGDVLWHASAEQTAYAAPIRAAWRGRDHILSFDLESISGWDSNTGSRRWQLFPNAPRGFFVPTPIILPDGLIVTGENLGSRRFSVDHEGNLDLGSETENFDFAPDMQSAVANSRWLLGVQLDLIAIDLKTMRVAWRISDKAFIKHCSLVATESRLLIVNEWGEIVLVDLTNSETLRQSPEQRIQGRFRSAADHSSCFAHPAVVGRTLYLRRPQSLQALSFSDE